MIQFLVKFEIGHTSKISKTQKLYKPDTNPPKFCNLGGRPTDPPSSGAFFFLVKKQIHDSPPRVAWWFWGACSEKELPDAPESSRKSVRKRERPPESVRDV